MAQPTLAYWTAKGSPTQYVDAIRKGLTGTVGVVEAHLSAVAKSLDARASGINAIVAERDAISQAFSARWSGGSPYAQHTQWVAPPPDLIQRLRTGRFRLGAGGRDKQRRQELEWSNERLFELEQLLVAELGVFASAWDRALPTNVRSPLAAPPALFAGIADTAADLSVVNPGEGPVVIQVGETAWTLEATVPQMSGPASSSLGGRTVQAMPPADSFPALIDLVRDGGFATDHRATVESAVVRLLALLPAGQLKVHLYDPVKVGASMKFLSDLGDTTRAAVADVRVVAADLEPMLDDLTRHVARVTQQYLGSRHASLADYNKSAGEVAEAYHVLVLMDFPTGRVDDDVMRKIDTLVKAGPACGVFTLILSPEPERYAFGLPALRDNTWSGSGPSIPGMRGILPTLRGASGGVTVDGIRSGEWRRYVSLHPQVYWRGSQWSPSSSAEVQKLVERLDRDVSSAKPRDITPTLTSQRLGAKPGRGKDANPDDPSTWWRKSAVTGLEAAIGVTGDRDVATVVFQSAGSEPGLLIGGQPGTGKSVLLHALICDLARNYSPNELQLYLLDPKQGVEFNVYAAGKLPHAKAITLRAGAMSTILVLEDLRKQIATRGAIFTSTRTASGANPDKLDDYLTAPGAKRLPRIVVVIDEFQALLNTGDDETSMRASSLLDKVIREGRAFGIHLVLATQSLQGITHLPSAVTNMIESKVVLRVSEDDSRLFLGANDLDAARLGDGNGKAILKRPTIGKKEIQVTNETKDSAHRTTEALAAKAPGRSGPTVLDFSRARPPSKLSAKADSPTALSLLVARGMGVTESAQVQLNTKDDAHLLLVTGPGNGVTPGPTIGTLSAMLATCVASKVPIDLIDFGDLQTPFDLALGQISQAVKSADRRFGRKNQFETYLDDALTVARHPGVKPKTRRVLFLMNTHREPRLLDDMSVADKLTELLEVAARGRVHVVLHSETGNAAANLLSAANLFRFFGSRLLARMDADSSYQLLGTNDAERLGSDELLLRTDNEKFLTAPFAPFPAKAWSRIAQ